MKRKRTIGRIATAALALTVLLSFVPAFAWNGNQDKAIRVGYFDYDGFLEKDRESNYSGYAYEYLSDIANYTGWQYEFVYGSWENCLRRLESGEIDILCSAQYTKERAEVFDYAKYDSGLEYGTLFVAEDNNAIFYEDFAAFNGIRVALLRDSYQNQSFEQYAKENGFTFEAMYYSSVAEMEIALQNDEVDAVLTGSLRKTDNEKVVAKFAPEPFYFTTTKGNDQLMEKLNIAMETIRTSDMSYNSKLYEKYYGNSSVNRLALTRAESAYVAGSPTITMAYDSDWAPYEYWDEEKESFSGISADLMRLIEQRSGLSFDFVQSDSYADALNSVMSGKVDLLCGYPRSQLQSERQNRLYLTKPYVSVPIALAVKKNRESPKIGTIAVPVNCPGLEQYAREVYPDATTAFFPTTEKCLEAVIHNDVDAVFENAYILDQYVKDSAYSNLETMAAPHGNYSVCIGVSQNMSVALMSILNKVISQISEEEVNRTIVNSTMAGPTISIMTRLRNYSIPLAIILLLVVLFLVDRWKLVLERYAYVDSLTGFRNQTRFLKDAERQLRGRTRRQFAILSLDINKFKIINEMYSFSSGDQLLKAIAEELNGDLSTDELFCRTASDHFIVLLRCENEAAFAVRPDQIVRKLCDIPAIAGWSFEYTISSGLYRLDNEDVKIPVAIDRANFARKSAKKAHITTVVGYNNSIRESVLREQEIENRMRPALLAEEYVVYYQPKYSLTDQKIIGAEALVRWRQEDGSMVPPDEFISIFESNGFIIQLDLYVFEHVCRQLREWLDHGICPLPVSVNLSRVQLYHPNFYDRYLEIMAEYRIPAYLIELELTESAMFDSKMQLVSVMRSLKEAGLSISMDDFGSGYSSLNLLKDMPIDFLKIDREFFNLSSDTERGRKIIRSVVQMANSLDIMVVSEGVETQEQVDFLKEISCDAAQGYYFSAPLPVKRFEELAYGDTAEMIA